MRVFDKVKTSPLWLVAPSLLVAGAVGGVVSSYEPLVFDPSLYATSSAEASELKAVDAEELEAENSSKSTSKANVETSSAAPSTDGLEDGTWTGYAACGEGNEDNWKPYYVAVEVNVAGGEVTGITNISGTSSARSGMKTMSWDAAENQDYLDRAIEGHGSDEGVENQINDELAAGNNPSDVDTVSGATYSSVAIYNAYVDAVEQASGSSGGTSASGGTATAKKAVVSKKKKKSQKAKKTKKKTPVGKLADGTWTAYAACGTGNEDGWKPYYVKVAVTVKGGKVAKVNKIAGSSTGEKGAKKLSWDAAENQTYLDWAVSGRTRSGMEYAGVKTQIEKAAKAGSTLASVDTVSGATYSSQAIFDAYYAALKKSAAAAGSAIKDPSSGKSGQDDASQDPAVTPDEPTAPEEDEGGIVTKGAYPDGVWSGHAYCEDLDDPGAFSPYYIIVEIATSGGSVTKVTDVYGDVEGLFDARRHYDAAENAYYLNRAINGFGLRTKGIKTKIQERLDAGLNVGAVDTVSGATWSSKSILEAYEGAVQAAAAAAAAEGEEAAAE